MKDKYRFIGGHMDGKYFDGELVPIIRMAVPEKVNAVWNPEEAITRKEFKIDYYFAADWHLHNEHKEQVEKWLYVLEGLTSLEVFDKLIEGYGNKDKIAKMSEAVNHLRLAFLTMSDEKEAAKLIYRFLEDWEK